MKITDKIVNLETLLSRIEHWRKVGEKVVFTNGCFDILHVGHISIFNHCASFGDRVIVGVNSDNSVKKLKGETRPINNENDRALVLASLQNVDAVIVFEEETPLNLITQILPDILVKGGDYKLHEIVGTKEVIANGGNVEIVPLVAGKSTTAISEKLKTNN
ncbi:MAG TPA: D-glycero-beta-D-manno-heptose 1-phosphate adenylyltransferase [Chitinophagales bacterium]